MNKTSEDNKQQTHEEQMDQEQAQPVQEAANHLMPKFPMDEVDIEDLAKEDTKEVEDWEKLGQVIERMKEEKRGEALGNPQQSPKNINPFIENDVDLEELLRMSEQLKEDNEKIIQMVREKGVPVKTEQEKEKIEINIIESEMEEEKQGNQEETVKIINALEENDIALEELLRMAEQLTDDSEYFKQARPKKDFVVQEEEEEEEETGKNLSEEELEIRAIIDEKIVHRRKNKEKEAQSVKAPVEETTVDTAELDRQFQTMDANVIPAEILHMNRPRRNIIKELQDEKVVKNAKKQIRKEKHVEYKTNLKENLNKIKVDKDVDGFLGGALGILNSELNFDFREENKNMKRKKPDLEIYQELFTMRALLEAYLEAGRKERDPESLYSISKMLFDTSGGLTETCKTVETHKYWDIAEQIHAILYEELHGKLELKTDKKNDDDDTIIEGAYYRETSDSKKCLEKTHYLATVLSNYFVGKVKKSSEAEGSGSEEGQDEQAIRVLEQWKNIQNDYKALENLLVAKTTPSYIGIDYFIVKVNALKNNLVTFNKIAGDDTVNAVDSLHENLESLKACIVLEIEKEYYEKNIGVFIEEKEEQLPLLPKGLTNDRYKKITSCKDKPLFPTPPCLEDIKQGGIGDCYLIAGIAACLNSNPEFPQEMMRDNGDTVTVRFFKPFNLERTDLRPIYVTVKKSTIEGPSKIFWVQMIEKAYSLAKMNGRYGGSAVVKNCDAKFLGVNEDLINYRNLVGGVAEFAVTHLTGKVNNYYQFRNVDTLKGTLNRALDEQLVNGTAGENVESFEIARENNLMALINRGNVNAVSSADVKKLIELLGKTRELHLKKFVLQNGMKATQRADPDSLDDIRILLEKDKSIKYQGATKKERELSKEYAILRITEFLFNSSSSNLTHSLGHENGYSRGAIDTFESMQNALANNKPVVASGTDYVPRGLIEAKREGIAESHAYSVVKCVKDGDRRFVVVHNPWGSEYGRAYALDENNKLIKQEAKSLDEARNGLCFIDLNDFMKSFSRIGF